MTLVKRVIYRQKGEEVIKLVKFLLLIVLIAPTYAWGCSSIKNQMECDNTVGCGWKSNQCIECETGSYSGIGSCRPCENGPGGADYPYGGEENGGSGDCPWEYKCDTNKQVNCTKNANISYL